MRKLDPREVEEAKAFAANLCRRFLAPLKRLKVSAWIALNFGRLSVDWERFPWIVPWVDSFSDYRVEESALIAPPQVGKSIGLEGGICYFVVEDPGDLTAYTHTIPLAKTWGEQRVIPSIRKCPACRPLIPLDPKLIRTTPPEILFGHMVLEVLADNESSTQSRTRRIVMGDERNMWDSGRAENARNRAKSPDFEGRRKVIWAGNSGMFESEWEGDWRASNQAVPFSACPCCGEKHPFKFSEEKSRRVPKSIPGFSIKWTENEVTRPEGVWNVDEVVKTVRLLCPSCHAEHEDTPKIRRQLRATMEFRDLNPKASPKRRFWAVPGVLCYPWASLVQQFLAANAQLELGDDKPMQEFMLKGLNEPWSEDVLFDTTTNVTGDYQLSGEAWEESTCAAMTVDVQELMPHFWFVIRDWGERGRSRLRRAGYANTWDELREIQQKEGLPDRYVHVDAGYREQEVHETCARWGWIALRGRDDDYFIHSKGLQIPVRRYFSEPRLVDPAIGTVRQGDRRRARAIEIMWANTPAKDILARLYSGKAAYFGVARDVPQYYLNHMASERKQLVKTMGSQQVRRWMRVGKRPNHLWDCEAMQVVFALIKGPLRNMAPEIPVTSEPKAEG